MPSHVVVVMVADDVFEAHDADKKTHFGHFGTTTKLNFYWVTRVRPWFSWSCRFASRCLLQ